MVAISKEKLNSLNQEDLLRALNYDNLTGIFTWLVSGGRKVPGDVAGTDDGHGYITIRIKYIQYKAHRLAWLYMAGEWPPNQIDHINHDKADNRFENLRLATNIENDRNRALYCTSTSGVCGVHWKPDKNKWRSSITINNKYISLGSHSDKFEAICARKSADNRYGFHVNHGH